MSASRVESLRIKAKLLQKAKLRAGKTLALKEAFAIIANKAGFSSWQEMKATVELHEKLRPPHAAALWNIWYATYAEGKAHITAHGGFLLPCEKQCFVCDADYIASLGLSLDDPDLAVVGSDWVVPADQAAFRRLTDRISQRGEGI